MITEEQRIQLKSVLKRNWADDVLALLKKRRVKNIHGEDHSKGNLRQVLYCGLENDKIEDAILDVYEDTLKKSKSMEARKQKLLSA